MFENRIRTVVGYVLEPVQDRIDELVEKVQENTPIIRELKLRVTELDFN